MEQLNYFLYARKSTDSDDKQAASIDDQISEMKAVALRHGIEIVDIIKESRSAKSPGRPEFTKMIERIHKGEANGILCWKLNRLARNPVDGGTISWILQQDIIKHIQTYSSTYKPTDNVLLMQVEFGMANQYVKDLSVDTKRGMRNKALRGWFPAGILPIGYKHNLDPQTRTSNEIIIDEVNYDIVKHLWNTLINTHATIPEIKRMGDSLDIRNPKEGMCIQ